MSDCLPEDIVEEILHRLPLKSIGKCIVVCKSWNLLIKSHNLFQQSSLSNPLFLVHHPTRRQYSLCSRDIECTFSLPKDTDYRFVSALNGLICLCFTQKIYRDNIFTFVLLNPLTRRHLQLSISGFSYSNEKYGSGLGFGFDSKNNDFKVVTSFYIDTKSKVYVPPAVELYSLTKAQPLFFQDNVYWLSLEAIMPYSGAFSSINNYILIFNMVKEKFSKMELSEVLARSLGQMSIIVIDGCLSIMEDLKYNNGWNIWMKRESWSNIQTVYLPRGMINAYPLGRLNTSSEAVLVISHGRTM
ncbi:F-box protein At3g07870-like [Gastrolobium bilobum]|uniref:F-box protein At3g07870-like n=1 Tax=Gastrolobium bilobum TaxID=150636 RepID=UPI002AAFB30A|nr:F-box protein At3g07870-like [Gastrolobium bilobum]